jgi:hypothetical protein
MSGMSKLSRRFEELATQLEAVAATKSYKSGDWMSGHYVDNSAFINWQLKARNLLSMACGESSLHFKDFVARESDTGYSTNYAVMVHLKAVFEAAREDFEGGFCNSMRTLIQSEVFDSELEQARALLDGGYSSAAAVIAGVVLETTLRQLCDNHNIAHGKLDKMNADLAKAGQYNVLKQKQVTAWADIRNNAAHGHPDKFTRDDVSDMIVKVEAFVAEQL